MDQNQTKRPNVESVITSPARRPPFEKTSCECGDAKMEPTSAICPTKYTPNTRMKICQCLARRKKLVIPFKFPQKSGSSQPEEGYHNGRRNLFQTVGQLLESRLTGHQGPSVSILFAQDASEMPNADAHQAAGREEQNQFEPKRRYWSRLLSSAPPNRNKLSSNRCSEEVAGQHETNNIHPITH